ncbi:MAG: hypothetical protein IJL88_08875 [Clostridia bacterium]|nr:hypothetical protein [Clostridia bacterium]
MRAGFGIAEITPPMGTELAGFGYYLQRRMEGIRDPLHARAAVLEEGKVRQLIVSCELLGLSQDVADAVIRHGRACGCTDAMIVSVHTHTGPAIKYHEGCGEVSPAYVSGLAGKIQQAVDAALADRREVTGLAFGRAEVRGDWIYNRADPKGPVDRDVRGFVLERAGGRKLALMGAACHGVFLGRTHLASADFSGEIIRNLEDMDTVYLNGLCGDIDPLHTGEERMCAFGKQAADTFRTSLHPVPVSLQAGRLPFSIHLTRVRREDILRAAEEAERRAGGRDEPAARVARTWEKEMLEKVDRLPEEEPGTAACMVLGGIPVLALPFEGFTAIGLRIREGIGQPDAMVLGCAEELRGYLPTRDDIARGSYAALESTFLYKRLPAVPGEAERLAEQLVNEYRQRVQEQQGTIVQEFVHL